MLENLNILKDSFLLPHTETSTQYKILYKAFSEVDDPEIKKALSGLFSSSLKRIQEILQSCLKGENIHIPYEKLESMLLMIWGIGDILWKKQVILGDDSGISNSPDIFVEMMTQLIRIDYVFHLAGIKRLVYTSSIHAFKNVPHGITIDLSVTRSVIPFFGLKIDKKLKVIRS